MTSREAQRRGFRLQTQIIPFTRAAGLAVVAALIPIHDAAMFGNPNWRAAEMFAAGSAIYCLASWLALRTFYLRTTALDLGVLFLTADVIPLIVAIALTGGPKSWLFFLLVGRCLDQVTRGFRRVVGFNHLLVGSYAALLGYLSTRGEAVHWPVEAMKMGVLYSFNWYCAWTARTIDQVRTGARRAETAKRAKAEFTGAVSHEIRTRLNGVLGLLELLQRTALNSKQSDYTQTAAECSRKMIGLITILDSGPMEANQLEIEPAIFFLPELLDEVASLMRPSAESKGVDFRIEIAEGTSPWVRGDNAKIRQTLLSLTHNAVRFTEVGFVEVRIWQAGRDRIAFQVRDSGAGITMNVQRRIFGLFKRADGSEWRAYGTRQMGLPMSKRLVELMGGALELETQLGAGTTIRFVLELPDCKRPIFAKEAIEPAPVSASEKS